ncbi:MAG: hypothetical protein IVW51_16665 [Thermaceae bacterium]|nr:hypothetical protein [Thermaceae bacterium]
MNKPANQKFAACIDNTGYPVALEIRKIYQIIHAEDAQKHRLLRIVDESGEDYLYPASCFALLDGFSMEPENPLLDSYVLNTTKQAEAERVIFGAGQRRISEWFPRIP